MNIDDVHPTKLELLRFALKFYKKIREDVVEDVEFAGQPVAKILHDIFKQASENISEKHQSNAVYKIAVLGLFTYLKDSAYRDIGDWILKKILENKDTLWEYVKDAPEPDEWYVNLWHNSKNKTRKLREKGFIDEHELSDDEILFVNEFQEDKYKEYMRKKGKIVINKNNKQNQ